MPMAIAMKNQNQRDMSSELCHTTCFRARGCYPEKVSLLHKRILGLVLAAQATKTNPNNSSPRLSGKQPVQGCQQQDHVLQAAAEAHQSYAPYLPLEWSKPTG